MTKQDKKVIGLLAKAYDCSSMGHKGDKLAYKYKDAYIHDALKILYNLKHSCIKYKITYEPDQNGHMSNVFVFEFKYKGVQRQMSFHNPHVCDVEKGHHIKWDGIKGQTAKVASLINRGRP